MEKYYHLKHEITVSVNDTDFRQRIKPGAIMSYFQDIASRHADILGCGYADMLKKNLIWVILRMSIKILKIPAIGETLELVTYPEKPGAAGADRGYYIYGKTGETVICGSSKWAIIDVDTHKLQRCAPVFDKHDLNLFIPHPPFEDVNPKIEKLPQSDTADGPHAFCVHVTDLDRNVHMNNARYGDAALDACGLDMLEKRSISRFDINFISQLFYGDRFDVYKLDKGGVSYIEAKKASGESGNNEKVPDTVFRARIEWC